MSPSKRFSTFHGDPKSLSPLSLAFIGDGIYELLVRSHLIENPNLPTKTLHRQTVSLVTAPTQAMAYDLLIDKLTPEEQDILRRGRNAKVARVPKSSSVEEYHKSTAVEALFGYLYLSGHLDRVEALFSLILESLDHKES